MYLQNLSLCIETRTTNIEYILNKNIPNGVNFQLKMHWLHELTRVLLCQYLFQSMSH